MKTLKYSMVAMKLMGKYVTDFSWLKVAGIETEFRLMKNCLFHFYSIFLFKKHSPYTSLFNVYIRRYESL